MGQESEIVGTFEKRSGAMQRVLALADRVASSDVGVVISGEPDTGRTRMAAHVHRCSDRAAGELVSVDCALLEEGSKRGLLDRLRDADGGGVLLMNAEGLSVDWRLHLASVLKTHQAYRTLYGGRPRGVRLFVVAATDLAGAAIAPLARGLVEHGLAVDLPMPPLRDRRLDVPFLVDDLLSEICTELGRECCTLTSDALDALEYYPWPGNFRELRHVLRRALVVAADGRRIDRCDLPRTVCAAPNPDGCVNETLAEVERRHVVATLTRHGGHRGATAEVLAISERTLLRRLSDYGLGRRRG